MFLRLKELYQRYAFYFPALIAFLMPLNSNYQLFIILWIVSFLCFDNIVGGIKKIFTNKWSYALIAFFVIHLISCFYSVNKPSALHNIDLKLAFLTFPVLIFSANYNSDQIKKICICFVMGCLAICITCLARALYMWHIDGFEAFFYSKFSHFIHPSYLAMYLIFAELLIIFYYKNWLGHLGKGNKEMIILSVIFSFCIFLCASKVGLLLYLIFFPTIIFFKLYRKGYKKYLLKLAVVLIIISVVLFKFFPTPFDRLSAMLNVRSSNAIDKNTKESNGVRILIWEEAAKLIKQNLLFGVTAGDTDDALIKAYEQDGVEGALKNKLNAHNQFLQTFLGTGLIGFICLCIITFGLIIYGSLKRNYILVLFSILITGNFIVESMLQNPAGVTFYLFFMCLLLKYNFEAFQDKVSV